MSKPQEPKRTRLDRRLERQAARAVAKRGQQPKPKRTDGRKAK